MWRRRIQFITVPEPGSLFERGVQLTNVASVNPSVLKKKITARGSDDWGITNLHIVCTETGHVSFRLALCLSSDLFLVGCVSTDFHPIEKTCRKIRQAVKRRRAEAPSWATPTKIFNSLSQSYTDADTHTGLQNRWTVTGTSEPDQSTTPIESRQACREDGWLKCSCLPCFPHILITHYSDILGSGRP